MKHLLLLVSIFNIHLYSSGQMSVSSDIIVNEILFNPPKDGFDYVEIYNRSARHIDLSGLLIAKRNVTGDLIGARNLSRNVLELEPDSYAIITANEKWLRQHYRVPDKTIVLQISQLPSFPDDAGTVILMNSSDSLIIDELHYNENWHFALITDRSGISLERIDQNRPTQDKNNWASASSSSGYGTPGTINSQNAKNTRDDASFAITPAIFSPDNDGLDDFVLVKFNMQEAPFVANVTIFDIAGRKVRYLLKNEYLGMVAQYNWDGLDDQQRALPQGIYIFFAELYNLKGVTKKYKKLVTLVRRT